MTEDFVFCRGHMWFAKDLKNHLDHRGNIQGPPCELFPMDFVYIEKLHKSNPTLTTCKSLAESYPRVFMHSDSTVATKQSKQKELRLQQSPYWKGLLVLAGLKKSIKSINTRIR